MTTLIESLNGIAERVRHLEGTEDYDTGDGAPSHFAAEGRQYWDYTNDALYVNNDGLNGWTFIGGTVPPGVPHAILSATHTDSTPAAVVRGDLITGQDTAGVTTWQRLGLGIGNAVLMSDGLDAYWGMLAPWNFPHELLSATHTDTVASVVTRGDLVVGTAGGWDDLGIGGAHQLLKVNAGGTDPAWASFDWDDVSAAAAADMVHDHSAAAEGGEIPLASLGSYTRGDLIVGGLADWTDLAIGGAGTYLRSDAADPSWQAITTADITDLAYAVPALTLGIANAIGAANTVIRSDATILVFDGVNPITLTVATVATGGVATVAAHRDHAHAITTSSNPGAAASILASDANGYLQLTGLGIGAACGAANQITMVDGGTIGQAAGPLIAFDDTLDYLEITGCDVSVGSQVPRLRLWATETDAATNTILPVLGLSHNSTNVPAAGFGTAFDFRQESSTTVDQPAARIQTIWTSAVHASRNALLRFDTFPNGATVGHMGFWSGDDIDNVAQDVIPGGAGDVTAIAYVGAAVEHSAGGTNAVAVSITPGNSAPLYDAAGNTLTCAIGAGGDMTVQRTAGAGSFDAAIWFMWV